MASSPRRDVVGSLLQAASKRILTLGSGDASQQRSMVEQSVRNVTTTFYDSEAQVIAKYPPAAANIEYLREHAHGGVLFGVDARRLTDALGKFDVVMFWFPHTGVPNNDSRNVAEHRALFRDFLSTVPSVLQPGGTIQIALKTSAPYDSWRFSDLVDESAGLEIRSTMTVDKSLFPGYVHVLTKGAHGPLVSVKDSGAKLYELAFEGSPDSAGARLREMDVGIELVVLTQANLCDAEVEVRALQILSDVKGQAPFMTVLDVRSRFDPALLPDTRQLNRVFYALEEAGRIKKCPPLANGRKSQKPTWTLVPTSSTGADAQP